jgi:hypothetical protein
MTDIHPGTEEHLSSPESTKVLEGMMVILESKWL